MCDFRRVIELHTRTVVRSSECASHLSEMHASIALRQVDMVRTSMMVFEMKSSLLGSDGADSSKQGTIHNYFQPGLGMRPLRTAQAGLPKLASVSVRALANSKINGQFLNAYYSALGVRWSRSILGGREVRVTQGQEFDIGYSPTPHCSQPFTQCGVQSVPRPVTVAPFAVSPPCGTALYNRPLSHSASTG